MRFLPVLMLAATATAAAPSTAGQATPVIQVPRLPAPPRLDAFVSGEPRDEPEQRMARVEGFIQQRPSDGAASTRRTVAYLGYDDRYLYVVFTAYDSEPRRIRAHLSRREDIFGDDIVEVMLDTFRDQRRAYAFIANPFGIQFDALWNEGSGFDGSFDTVWESEGRLTSWGYAVRFAIPFRSLRFPSAPKHCWGLILVRDIPHLDEETFWPYVSSRIEGRLNQAALLCGLEGISPGRNAQIIPYGRAQRGRTLETPDGEDASFLRQRGELDAGLDAKWVFRDALVVDATVNPDFSEVESDSPQITVNRRFEVFFPEKRPFFLENSGIFRTPLSLVFTRRIVEPRIGARVTGKLGPWALGFLAIDDESPLEEASSPDLVVGSRAHNRVVRLSRDVGRQSTLGFIATERKLGDGWNRVLGVDSRLKLNDHWTLEAQAASSGRRGLGGAEKTAGPAYVFRARRSGRFWEADLRYNDVGAGFASDLGFIPRNDLREAFVEYERTFWPEGRRLISWGPELSLRTLWDRDGLRLDRSAGLALEFEFRGQLRLEITRDDARERLRPKDFDALAEPADFRRGGARLFVRKRSRSYQLQASWRREDSVNFAPVDGAPPAPADDLSASVEVGLRLGRRLRVDHTYLLSRLTDDATGRRVFRNQIVRSRWSYQFTRRLTLRSIFQYEATRADPSLTSLETRRSFNGDLLFTYLVNPWTAVFAGATSNYQNLALESVGGVLTPVRTPGGYLNDARQFFLKFSYLIQP